MKFKKGDMVLKGNDKAIVLEVKEKESHPYLIFNEQDQKKWWTQEKYLCYKETNNKGTFMWAVEQMKLGKKVNTPDMGKECFFFMEDNKIKHQTRGEITSICSDLLSQYVLNQGEYGNKKNWEVVEEDKDWNLAEQLILTHQSDNPETIHHACIDTDIKKCRNLILKDLEKLQIIIVECSVHGFSKSQFKEIINKRFGGLQ